MKSTLYTLSILAVFAFFMNMDASAQCRRFTQKNCLPELAPFINNGQINTTSLFEGDSASLVMTFYSLLDYRLLVCSHPVLGENVHFKVRDMSGTLLYDSQGSGKIFYDFSVASTQDLRIDVIVPEQKDNLSETTPSGCASIVLGFRE
ncbi:hypothetical protein KFE98_06970 [bacterium SCSIO 12741]|nr:hypothetical protein KFE98_06970 [bacterium SCSIO 12741]